ncbi:DUF397 domain-containing protein [Streptomyces sudanensis]|uniref:DUF397 domain-containing protein n=1 Tax=Streptomyces sudanensis TaxID=436397 RepID=UPI0020CDA0EC|nr:DUF397 domain-containing protein [Streptomyces sudanensis]MCP9959893.1 DUF397 domain-containing protein [Streptomyces sudanensis]MCP9999705.1 DUF397 domain-containing protein [Streptomyces sudanensis]
MSTDQHVGRPDLSWFKSSYSGTSGGDCVEVAASPGTVHVRDSKRTEAALAFSREQWAAFTAHARGASV